jgi:hypothetical protein
VTNKNEGLKRIALVIKVIGVIIAIIIALTVGSSEYKGDLILVPIVFGIFYAIGWIIDGFAKES